MVMSAWRLYFAHHISDGEKRKMQLQRPGITKLTLAAVTDILSRLPPLRMKMYLTVCLNDRRTTDPTTSTS